MNQRQYRGKRVDGEGWVYGSYVYNDREKTHWIVYTWEDGERNFQVIAKTVGQSTGCVDKSWKEIYEADIITADRYPFFDEGKPNYVGVVEWIFSGWQYVMTCVNPNKRGISNGNNELLDYDGEGGKNFTVIGNIHDNPELLQPQT